MNNPAEEKWGAERDRGRARWRRPLASMVALAALCGAPGAAGQDVELRITSRISEPAASPPQLGAEGDVLPLTLEEAIALALERNVALVVQRFDRAQANFGLARSLGIYDLSATFDLSATDESSPTASNLSGAQILESQRENWNIGLSQLTPFGGTASLDWRNTRSETNSQFATLNPSYSVSFDFSFIQPLLKDFGRSNTDRGIRIAQNNLGISRETFEQQVEDTIRDVVEAYWGLVEAQAQLGVAEESLALAGELHQMNQIRVEVGTLAPLELLQSEVGIATRQEEIIRARAAVEDAADRLRRLLNVGRPELWELPIEPTTDPEMEPLEIDLEESIETALSERPGVRSQRLAIRNLEVDAGYFRNQRLPRFDLALTYGYNGIGGDVILRDFFSGEILRTASGSYGDALDQITNLDFDGWVLSLNFAYPLQNRAARAQDAIADVELDKGRAELEDLELLVITEVRTASRAVNTAAQQIESARVSRRLAEENLEAERKRYENGMSTSFQVLEIQEDLTGARSREVAAVTGYRRAVAGYYRAIGRLIEETGVEIVDAGRGRSGAED